MQREKITVAELYDRFHAQGVNDRLDIAFKCPRCHTVQSMRMLIDVGCAPEDAENKIGYSCVGRLTGRGGHTKNSEPGKGCDWTLGGLLRLHTLEVILNDGKVQPSFAVATDIEAQALAAKLKEAA